MMDGISRKKNSLTPALGWCRMIRNSQPAQRYPTGEPIYQTGAAKYPTGAALSNRRRLG
jgi:hypothetical protein